MTAPKVTTDLDMMVRVRVSKERAALLLSEDEDASLAALVRLVCDIDDVTECAVEDVVEADHQHVFRSSYDGFYRCKCGARRTPEGLE